RGIVVRNNLFHDMGGPYGGSGWFLLIGDAPRDLVFDHNTISSSSNAIVVAYGGTREDPKEILGFRFTNNAARHSKYGINGQSFSFGNDVIRHYFPDSTITANYLAGGSPSRYPAGNLTEGAFELEFVDAEGGDFRLRANSQLRGKATDRGDIGADMGTLLTRVTDVEAGLPGVSVPTVPTNFRIVSR
ncbi:MAG: hypothetical protein ACRD15_13580, partial [Vicinamibacterales bacterium]